MGETNEPKMSSLKQLLAVSLLFGAAGCGPSYAFIPQENATATMDGKVASLYQVPPDRPEGDVEVASLGIDRPAHGPAAMHVRMVVANDSDQPWVVDTRRQIAVVPRMGRIEPLTATSTVSQPPRISVPPDREAVVDLFFPLPPGAQEARDLPRFDVIWRVRTDRGPISERTQFGRHRTELVDSGAYDDYPLPDGDEFQRWGW